MLQRSESIVPSAINIFQFWINTISKKNLKTYAADKLGQETLTLGISKQGDILTWTFQRLQTSAASVVCEQKPKRTNSK